MAFRADSGQGGSGDAAGIEAGRAVRSAPAAAEGLDGPAVGTILDYCVQH
jgi:hypothetical protein